MQMNVCDPHSGQNVLVGKYKLVQKCVRVCVYVSVCAEVHVHANALMDA